MASPRNYKKEYANYHVRPLQKVNRAGRNKARKLAVSKGAALKGDGKDVHHVDGNPRNNSSKNFRVVKKSANRSKK